MPGSSFRQPSGMPGSATPRHQGRLLGQGLAVRGPDPTEPISARSGSGVESSSVWASDRFHIRSAHSVPLRPLPDPSPTSTTSSSRSGQRWWTDNRPTDEAKDLLLLGHSSAPRVVCWGRRRLLARMRLVPCWIGIAHHFSFVVLAPVCPSRSTPWSKLLAPPSFPLPGSIIHDAFLARNVTSSPRLLTGNTTNPRTR